MDQWFYASNGQQLGPVSMTVLQQLAAGGQLTGADLVWHEGMAAWTPAVQVPGIFPAAVNPAGPAAPLPYHGYAPQQGYAQQPASTNTGLIVSGYICSSLGLLCCIFVAVAGLVLGIILLNKNEKTHGTWIVAIASVGILLQIGFSLLRYTPILHHR